MTVLNTIIKHFAHEKRFHSELRLSHAVGYMQHFQEMLLEIAAFKPESIQNSVFYDESSSGATGTGPSFHGGVSLAGRRYRGTRNCSKNNVEKKLPMRDVIVPLTFVRASPSSYSSSMTSKSSRAPPTSSIGYTRERMVDRAGTEAGRAAKSPS